MPEARKRPCSICRRWFRPDPRVGRRQWACTKPECQQARRGKTQANWRARNPDYFTGHRILRRATLDQPPDRPRLPAPLNQLPWDIAQDQFGIKGVDFIGVLSRLLLSAAQDQFLAHIIDSKPLASTLPPSTAKDQTRPAPILNLDTIATHHATGVSSAGPPF